jgi:hypothetical protein
VLAYQWHRCVLHDASRILGILVVEDGWVWTDLVFFIVRPNNKCTPRFGIGYVGDELLAEQNLGQLVFDGLESTGSFGAGMVAKLDEATMRIIVKDGQENNIHCKQSQGSLPCLQAHGAFLACACIS